MDKQLSNILKQAKQIVKKTFPNVKMSAKVTHYHACSIHIQKSDFQIFTNPNDYGEINEYWYKRNYDEGFYTDQGFELIHLIISEVLKDCTYRETSDYGTQPSIYMHLHVDRNYLEVKENAN